MPTTDEILAALRCPEDQHEPLVRDDTSTAVCDECSRTICAKCGLCFGPVVDEVE